MAEEGKKISFGFSKSIKKPVLKNAAVPEKKKIDFIECLEGKSIKVIGGEEKNEGPLVIPMLGSKTWHDRILNKVDADIFEPKEKKVEIKKELPDTNELQNGHELSEIKPMEVVEIKKEPLSLDELAAQEIIQDSQKEVKQEVAKDFTLPLTEANNLAGEKESTLEDYENIPIEAFGLAMLRGMGWKDGKNEKALEPKLPEIRPRGMGLGADKVTTHKQDTKPKTKEEEQLKLEVGAFVRIIAGKYNNNYGLLEGFDEEAGRLIVKLALGGNAVSINESLVEPVTKTEYSKNSKVLNASKYEEYKNKSSKGDSKKHETNPSLSETKKKSRKHDSSDESSGSDCQSSKRKSSSDSEDECREKKSKRKHRHRDRESSRHSNKKSKKKDKDRERTRDRKSDYSESLDRRRNKKHKRSRS